MVSTNDFLERNGSPERIDHRSNAERGIDETPTVNMGVAACQMEKKGIATGGDPIGAIWGTVGLSLIHILKYLSVQREKSRKYSQRWQQQHTADELKTIAAAVNYLSEHGISNLDELDASLSLSLIHI